MTLTKFSPRLSNNVQVFNGRVESGNQFRVFHPLDIKKGETVFVSPRGNQFDIHQKLFGVHNGIGFTSNQFLKRHNVFGNISDLNLQILLKLVDKYIPENRIISFYKYLNDLLSLSPDAHRFYFLRQLENFYNFDLKGSARFLEIQMQFANLKKNPETDLIGITGKLRHLKHLNHMLQRLSSDYELDISYSATYDNFRAHVSHFSSQLPEHLRKIIENYGYLKPFSDMTDLNEYAYNTLFDYVIYRTHDANDTEISRLIDLRTVSSGDANFTEKWDEKRKAKFAFGLLKRALIAKNHKTTLEYHFLFNVPIKDKAPELDKNILLWAQQISSTLKYPIFKEYSTKETP